MMNAKDPETLVAEGMQHIQNDDPESAVTLFTAAVELNPEDGQAWYGKGCAHGQLEQYDQAIHAYQQSAKFAGERAGLPLFNLGNVYQETGQLQEAADCFQQAAAADPTMADAWINLGRILDDSDQHLAAVDCYDLALEVEPQDSMAWSNRGNSLRSLGRFSDGLESYRKAVEFDENDIAAKIGVGVCLIGCGQPDEGIAALGTVTEETGHPLAMFELATALAMTDRHEAAASMYDTLLKADFETAEIWNNQAECLWRMGQIEKALQSFDRAIKFDEEFAPAWFGKARVLANEDRVDEARPVAEHFLKIVDDDERSSPAVQSLAQLCGIS